MFHPCQIEQQAKGPPVYTLNWSSSFVPDTTLNGYVLPPGQGVTGQLISTSGKSLVYLAITIAGANGQGYDPRELFFACLDEANGNIDTIPPIEDGCVPLPLLPLFDDLPISSVPALAAAVNARPPVILTPANIPGFFAGATLAVGMTVPSKVGPAFAPFFFNRLAGNSLVITLTTKYA